MKQSKAVVRACQALRSYVRFRHAGFSLSKGFMSNVQDTEKIREATERYMESWVIPLIDAIERGDTAMADELANGASGEQMGPRNQK